MQSKKDATVIRMVFKGESKAYRLIIEQYQPMAYAVALAVTRNVYLADRAVAATFKECYPRLVSLTDPKRLGQLICALSRHEAEQLARRQVPDWNRPRKRTDDEMPVDLKWVQSELMEPLNEEINAFSIRERQVLLLHAFCGLSARMIADVLKIDRKDAAEDLARTRENVEKALLKEVFNALYPEINNKERMLGVLRKVAGDAAADEAARETTLGRPRHRLLPVAAGIAALLVIVIAGYFGFTVYRMLSARGDAAPGTVAEAPAAPGADDTAADREPPREPGNFTISGRIVDDRFGEDGVAGLIVEAGGRQAETDFYGDFEISGVQRGQHEATIFAGDVELMRGVPLRTEERNLPVGIVVDHNVPARFRFQGRVFDRNSGQTITRFETATSKEFPDMLQPYLLHMGLFREQRHPEGLLSDRFVTLGDYTMYVRAPGYAPLPLHFTIDEHWDGRHIHEFGLYRAVALEGAVFSASELSLAGVAVLPRQGTAYGTSTGNLEYMRTDTMGRFSLDSLTVGVQSFIFHHMQHGTGRAIVMLEPGQTEQIRVRFPRRGALTGDITLNRRPARFTEFRRRIGGAAIDMTRNITYISPGQYEILLSPEPAPVAASIAPGAGDRWFNRRIERTVSIATGEVNWLDFNYESGPGVLQGNVSLRGSTARTLFAEVVYAMNRGDDRERIFFKLGGAGAFHLDRLPVGRGELVIYAAPGNITEENFSAARGLMDRSAQPFAIEAGAPQQSFNFTL